MAEITREHVVFEYAKINDILRDYLVAFPRLESIKKLEFEDALERMKFLQKVASSSLAPIEWLLMNGGRHLTRFEREELIYFRSMFICMADLCPLPPEDA